MIMVHAPAAEKQAAADGRAIKRELIGSNEFYIVGPPNHPSGSEQTPRPRSRPTPSSPSSQAQGLPPRRKLRHP